MTVFGQHIVILNDLQLAVDLMDKKSSVFSDRPELVMCGQLYVFPLAPQTCYRAVHHLRINLQMWLGQVSGNDALWASPQDDP